MEPAVPIVNIVPPGVLIPVVPCRPICTIVNLLVGPQVLTVNEAPGTVKVPTQASSRGDTSAQALSACTPVLYQFVNSTDTISSSFDLNQPLINNWMSAPNRTISLSLAFQSTKNDPVSDNTVPSNPLGQPQHFPVSHHASTLRQLKCSRVSNNTTSASLPLPKDNSLNKQTSQAVFLVELPVHKYPISRLQQKESQCKKTERSTSLQSHKTNNSLNKLNSETVQRSDGLEVKLPARTYPAIKNKRRKSQHEETPNKPVSFCPHNDRSKLTTAKLASFHKLNKIYKETDILNEHNGKNCGKVVFRGEIKQTTETKEREMMANELKQNKSVRPSCVRQSRGEVCKSVNEVGDSIDDCEENENKQCQNNSVKIFHITKTNQNDQCSVFAHVENNCIPNSKDNINTDCGNGKSKKHREEKKVIVDENVENKIKISSINSEVNEISEVTAADGTDVHGDEKCDDVIVVAHHKTRQIKMESNAVITIDDSDDEDLGNKSKISSITIEVTEPGEVIAKDKTHVHDDDDGDGVACHYKARSIEMASKSLITIDNDDDSKSKDDIDIIIVDEDDEKELSSKARTTIMITEQDLNISDVKLEVLKSEEVSNTIAFEVPEEFIKEGNDRNLGLTETSYYMTDGKKLVEGIKAKLKDPLEWSNNSNNLPEEVSISLCPFQYPDLSKDVKAGVYFQTNGSSEVIEDSLDSRLVIDEIKEENQIDLSFEPSYDSCSGSCKSPTPDLEHSTAVLGNKTEFSSISTETEMITAEKETFEVSKCSSTSEEIHRVRCFTCKKSFPYQRVLAKHILNHTGGKVFPCDECCMKFILISQLTAHKDRKHFKTFYNCKHCGASFNTRSKLMNHVSIHTGERPYYCGGCGDMFSSNSELVEHSLKSGERPFYCEKCGARFPWKSMLRVHQKIHSEMKKCNVCPVCSQGFRYSVLLLMHQVSARHGVPYWYEEGLNAWNPKRQQQRLKLCFRMLKVAPKKVRGKLCILVNQNAAQVTKIEQISKKEKEMDVEEEIPLAAETKGGVLSLAGTKRPREMSPYKELNEGGCCKRIYIKQTQKPSKCRK